MKREKPRWAFTSRLRARAFGPRSSSLACERIRQAVSEVRKAARKDPVRAAEGALLLMEKLVPAIEIVDGSSGALGNATSRALEELISMIARAPLPETTREDWLARVWQAYQADEFGYLDVIGERWGELCASPEVASRWADRIVPALRSAWGEAHRTAGHFRGAEAGLSCLLASGRHRELLELIELAPHPMWFYRKYGARSLAAQGRVDEGIRYAEAARGRNQSDPAIAAACEEMLIAAGRVEEAYERYAVEAHPASTGVATFHAIARRYPGIEPARILSDLMASTPGDEGRWFATAKEMGLLHVAEAIAKSTPCEPRTLNRAAALHAERNPAFAHEVALASLRWLAQGWGYEITSGDVRDAMGVALRAAELLGCRESTLERAREIVRGDTSPGFFVRRVLARSLGIEE